MKVCPLCKTKFEDSAEFCPHCKALLEDLVQAEQEEKKPIPKSFWIALIGSFAFIAAMVVIYKLVYSQLLP